MALAGPPRCHEKELPPRLFSHQWSMALVAGPPRRDENKESSSPWSDVGFAWCNQSPYTPVWRRSLIGTPNCSALEHEHQTLDRRGSSRRRPYFHISAQKGNSANFVMTEFSEVRIQDPV